MAHQTPTRNPFMLMLNPEVVLAAVQNSEHLSQLNRHLCRPLDRASFASAKDVEEVLDGEQDAADEQEPQ